MPIAMTMTVTTMSMGVAAALSLATLGCAAEPVYDDTIGLAGVPTDPGALAGRFALVFSAADEADVPLLGKQVGGGMTFALVDRAWDGAAYATSYQVCRVLNYDVAGLSTVVERATARAIPPVTLQETVEHDSGAYSTERYLELWAVHDVDADDALPETVDDERVYDMDDDDKPAATLLAHGLVEGELYFVQRKAVALDGVIRGPDEVVGLITHQKDGFVLDATDDLLKTNAVRHQHPDPKESWFHLTRFDGDCDDVESAADDESLSMLRPF